MPAIMVQAPCSMSAATSWSLAPLLVRIVLHIRKPGHGRPTTLWLPSASLSPPSSLSLLLFHPTKRHSFAPQPLKPYSKPSLVSVLPSVLLETLDLSGSRLCHCH